jgi:lipoprotein-anchoring transpeptidase ErfK/SrfK
VFTTVYLFQSFTSKQKVVKKFKDNISKIKMYSKWGYDTVVFEKLYNNLLTETNQTSFFVFPFKSKSLIDKHDNILRLTQAGYATEFSKQKSIIQNRLTYLRDRVKTSTVLSQSKKQVYFDSLEVVAGNVFERNNDLKGLSSALAILVTQDGKITKEVETLRKESLINELRNYRTTCEELLLYFTNKNSKSNIELSESCVVAADKLLQPEYTISGADFIETLSRERVFISMQKALQAKQQIIQDEEYARAAKKKEEERLTIVPPAPRQEGRIVVVNINLQRLYAYENGMTLFPSAVPITTGKQGFETVTGEFAIYVKEQNHKMVSPFPGIYYDDVVNYWMPFYLGYGLHDAPWRSVYGTQDFGAVGSHGCVNIPFKETSILYNWADIGTRVLVL